MLKYRKFSYKYESFLKISSFNKLSINKTSFYIRTLIRYVFFFLLKKTFLSRLLFLYKLMLLIITNKNESTFSISSYFIVLNYLYISHIKSYYLSFLTDNFFLYSKYITLFESFFYFYYYNNNNIFINLYKNYIFFTYLWLFTVKAVFYNEINWSSLPTAKRLFVVLRSPHKDKKAREKFKLNKIMKNIGIPSFLYHSILLYQCSNDSFLLKCFVNIKKK